MGSTECPECSASDWLVASVSPDIASQLDEGYGLLTASCQQCGERVVFEVSAKRSYEAGGENERDGVKCPTCGEANVESAVPSDGILSQLEQGYAVLEVSCMTCGNLQYNVETVVEETKTVS